MTVIYDERTADVSRAVGVVAAHSDCSCEEALAMLRARAVIFDQSVDQIANAVLDRNMRFSYAAHPRPRLGNARRFN